MQAAGAPGDGGDAQRRVDGNVGVVAGQRQAAEQNWLVELGGVDYGQSVRTGRDVGDLGSAVVRHLLDDDLFGLSNEVEGGDDPGRERQAAQGVQTRHHLNEVREPVAVGVALVGPGADRELPVVGQAIAVGVDGDRWQELGGGYDRRLPAAGRDIVVVGAESADRVADYRVEWLIAGQEELPVALVVAGGPQDRRAGHERSLDGDEVVAVVERGALVRQADADGAQVEVGRPGVVGGYLDDAPLQSDGSGVEVQVEAEAFAGLQGHRQCRQARRLILAEALGDRDVGDRQLGGADVLDGCEVDHRSGPSTQGLPPDVVVGHLGTDIAVGAETEASDRDLGLSHGIVRVDGQSLTQLTAAQRVEGEIELYTLAGRQGRPIGDRAANVGSGVVCQPHAVEDQVLGAHAEERERR